MNRFIREAAGAAVMVHRGAEYKMAPPVCLIVLTVAIANEVAPTSKRVSASN